MKNEKTNISDARHIAIKTIIGGIAAFGVIGLPLWSKCSSTFSGGKVTFFESIISSIKDLYNLIIASFPISIFSYLNYKSRLNENKFDKIKSADFSSLEELQSTPTNFAEKVILNRRLNNSQLIRKL